MSAPAQPDAVISAAERTRLDQLLVEILADLELDYERPAQGAFLVKLPGEHKLATMCWLVVQDFSLLVEAFFMRKPDENAEGLYRWLLQRNAKMYGLAFSVDRLGDVFLVGRQPLSSISQQEIDRLLGCMLRYSDDAFDTAVGLGFASSIRREWDWRRKRGESTANLAAFARFAGPEE